LKRILKHKTFVRIKFYLLSKTIFFLNVFFITLYCLSAFLPGDRHAVKKSRLEADGIQMFDQQIPAVSLLVQGSPACLDHVAFYVANKLPVVVLRGSGGLADILGYVLEELKDK